MTTPPRLRLVHGGSPGPARGDGDPREDDEPDDGGGMREPDGPDTVIDAGFPDDAPARARQREDEAARAAARAARRAARARQVVAGLVVLQLLACLRDLRWYVPLLRDGSVNPVAALALPACLALYVATGLLVARRASGACRTLCILAAMALVVAVPFWGITADWSWPLELGATLALAGAWVARPALAPTGRDSARRAAD